MNSKKNLMKLSKENLIDKLLQKSIKGGCCAFPTTFKTVATSSADLGRGVIDDEVPDYTVNAS